MPTNCATTGNQTTSNASPQVQFSVVIPVYNSESTLEPLVQRIAKVFSRLGRSYEIVLTDDGSRDASWQLIQRLHDAGYPIRAFRFMRNHGQHFALKCGLDHCAGDYAITMDDDLQHPPEEIPKLIAAIEADEEVDVIAGRYEGKKHSVFRNLGTWLTNRIECILFNKSPGLALTSFRIINRAVLDEVKRVNHVRPRIGLILLSITSRIKNVTLYHEAREVGKSGYTLRRMIGDTLDSIINYSSFPLRMVSCMGIGSALISLILAIYFLVKYLIGKVGVSGFTSTILLLLFTSGVILFCFGLVGEYLERIISQQMMAAQYHVRDELPPPAQLPPSDANPTRPDDADNSPGSTA